MTGLKDPGISSETWDAYKTSSDGRSPFASSRSGRAGDRWSGARELIAERGAMTKPYETHRRRSRHRGRGQAVHRWQRRRAHGVALRRLEQGLLRGTDTGNRGYPASNPDTVRQLIRLFHDAGIHVSAQPSAIAASTGSSTATPQALRENPKKGLRHGIIHANIPTDRAIDIMASCSASSTPAIPNRPPRSCGGSAIRTRGTLARRARCASNPFKTFLAKGIRWANGSDYGVTPFPARYGIWAAVAREPLLGVYGGDPFGRDESVDVRTALHAVTIWAARQMFLENEDRIDRAREVRRPRRVGPRFYCVPTAQLKECKCQLTVFNGKVVYEAPVRPGPS